ncbi:PAS domain-containing protein [Mycobacterium yunnanensis]|uniref:PAS domain-containing protein n=1 Tax=Mycobacterium yunnanensis TaxID=368477 RepID=UPI0021F31751|nr:PAS domain S-box protein [Mycobacterium yunnanensis]
MSENSSTVDQVWLAREIVAQSPEAIVVTDPHGLITLWNAGAVNMFGFSVEEALGASLDLIIPVKLRDRHWRGYQHTMDTGVTKYGDSLLAVPALHRDGHQLSIEFSVALLRDDAGTVVGISAVMREVTERRAEEKALRARLAEAERTVTELRATVAYLSDRVPPFPTMSVQGWSEQPCTATSFNA